MQPSSIHFHPFSHIFDSSSGFFWQVALAGCGGFGLGAGDSPGEESGVWRPTTQWDEGWNVKKTAEMDGSIIF